jgi:hypothetical protein
VAQAEPACYRVYRRVHVPGVGMVRKRVIVCE